MSDPRGPERVVADYEVKPHQYDVLLSCGHLAGMNRQFSPPKIGEKYRCIRCRNSEQSNPNK